MNYTKLKYIFILTSAYFMEKKTAQDKIINNSVNCRTKSVK